MFLVGVLRREYSDIGSNSNPMIGAFLTEDLDAVKKRLAEAASDDDYQVINLTTLEYFDPKANRWIKIEKL